MDMYVWFHQDLGNIWLCNECKFHPDVSSYTEYMDHLKSHVKNFSILLVRIDQVHVIIMPDIYDTYEDCPISDTVTNIYNISLIKPFNIFIPRLEISKLIDYINFPDFDDLPINSEENVNNSHDLGNIVYNNLAISNTAIPDVNNSHDVGNIVYNNLATSNTIIQDVEETESTDELKVEDYMGKHFLTELIGFRSQRYYQKLQLPSSRVGRSYSSQLRQRLLKLPVPSRNYRNSQIILKPANCVMKPRSVTSVRKPRHTVPSLQAKGQINQNSVIINPVPYPRIIRQIIRSVPLNTQNMRLIKQLPPSNLRSPYLSPNVEKLPPKLSLIRGGETDSRLQFSSVHKSELGTIFTSKGRTSSQFKCSTVSSVWRSNTFCTSKATSSSSSVSLVNSSCLPRSTSVAQSNMIQSLQKISKSTKMFQNISKIQLTKQSSQRNIQTTKQLSQRNIQTTKQSSQRNIQTTKQSSQRNIQTTNVLTQRNSVIYAPSIQSSYSTQSPLQTSGVIDLCESDDDDDVTVVVEDVGQICDDRSLVLGL